MIVEILAGAVIRHHVEHASRSHFRPSLKAGHEWSGVAECESGGDWSINTGNGYFGGLQFSEQSWAAMGGLTYASRPDLASEAAQITVAERLLAVQGPEAWPVCGRYLRGNR